MAKIFYITTKSAQSLGLTAAEGDAQTVQIDASAWAGDNSAVTAATWAIQSGNATVSGTSLASSVASAIITTANAGASLISCTLTDGTRTKVVYVKVKASKPFVGVLDYGLCA